MTIKEVSEMIDLSSDTLRYYEKVGLIGKIKKNKSGIRNYDDHDLQRIQFIKCMRSADLPIEVLKKYIELYEIGESTKEERKNLLDKQREILEKKIELMKEAHERLITKINLYSENKLDNYLEFTEESEKNNKE